MERPPLSELYPTEAELRKIDRMVRRLKVGTLLDVREAHREVLLSRGVTPKRAGHWAGVSQAFVLTAAAAQEEVVGGFTRNITIDLTQVARASVHGLFKTSVNSGLFLAESGDLAPNSRGVGYGHPAQIYHTTEVGQTIFDVCGFSKP